MPPRLAVIISQASSRDHRAAEIEEALVGELMMTGGLDANLVGPLQRIQPDSTDLLCLAGFTQEMALVSWLSLDEAQRVWRELQLTGTLVEYSPATDRPSTSFVPPDKGRRVAYLQLNLDSTAAKICQLLKARLQDLQVKTVSLLPLVPPKSLSAQPRLPPATLPHFPEARPQSPTTPPSTSTYRVVDKEDDDNDEAQWHKLDQLVDDLDALDL